MTPVFESTSSTTLASTFTLAWTVSPEEPPPSSLVGARVPTSPSRPPSSAQRQYQLATT